MEIVDRDEFEQAMAELGLTKCCGVCDDPLDDFTGHIDPDNPPKHCGSPCRGYGSAQKIVWRKR